MSRSIPAYAQPAFLEYVSAGAARGDEDAIRLLDKVKKKAPRKTLVLPGRTKDERRQEHRESTSDLRADVWKRCGGTVVIGEDGMWVLGGGGKCEVSGVELGARWEMHHLVSGGARRSAQSLDNCLAVSFDVHRRLHRGDLATLRDVKAACIRLGLREGLRATEHRIAKCEEARR
jgi:hypothetical protein